MQSGKKHGMQTLNDALYQAYMSREVALEECLRVSSDPTEFLRMVGEQVPGDEDAAPMRGPNGSGKYASTRR
jgi:twitching motility protein PilT